MIEDKTKEAYNQEEDLSEIFYYNLNKIENSKIRMKTIKNE